MVDLLEAVPQRVLAVYAHPDDPDISCGGTLAKWSRAGSEIHVVICAAGDKGSADPDADPAVVAGRRADEARQAALILRIAGLHLLGRPDGEFENDLDLRRELVTLMRAHRPDVVICPDPITTTTAITGPWDGQRSMRLPLPPARRCTSREPVRLTRFPWLSCPAPSRRTSGSTSRRRLTTS
jgi:hypothetical protein